MKKLLHSLTLVLLSITMVTAQEKPEVKIGGALRYNFNYSSWKDHQKTKFGYDMLAFNPQVSYRGVKLNVEYRLYAEEFGAGFLRYGYVGYNFNKKDEIHIGLTQVPLGIQKYNSHSYYLGMGYYLGIEDDYDMGVKFIHTGDKLDYQLAFFTNSEEVLFGSESESTPRRYSYDVAGRNKEVNQVNLKIVYKYGDKFKQQLGASFLYGGLYNLDTYKTGDNLAFAFHYELNYRKFDLKAQALSYEKNPKNAQGESEQVVSLAAYNLYYDAAAKATLYTLGIGYSIPVKWNPISDIQIYNDFAYLDKNVTSFEESISNTTGIMVHAGGVYAYIEYINARNQPWFGPEWTNAFSTGDPNTDWHYRFNINIGYYF